MRFWTGYMLHRASPVLIGEGFAWGALLLGPLWLATHRAWIPAALVIAACVTILSLASGGSAAALLTALAVWLGFCGNDLLRWSLRRRGFMLFAVVIARDANAAFTRSLDRRPELASSFVFPGAA